MVPAGPGSRLAAWLIDANGAAIAMAGLISLFVGGVDVASPAAHAITAPVLWLHLSLLQVTGMQTVGKRLLGIRVVRRDGSAVAAPQMQGLHDRLARTAVIRC